MFLVTSLTYLNIETRMDRPKSVVTTIRGAVTVHVSRLCVGKFWHVRNPPPPSQSIRLRLGVLVATVDGQGERNLSYPIRPQMGEKTSAHISLPYDHCLVTPPFGAINTAATTSRGRDERHSRRVPRGPGPPKKIPKTRGKKTRA